MGMVLYPVFDGPVPAGSKTTGECLAAFLEELDRACESLGLTPLTAFADNRPVPDGFAGDPSELDEIMGPCMEWFDPASGRRAVDALADAIAGHPEQFEEIADAAARDCVQAEVRDLSEVLARAAATRVRFRLELS